MAESSGQKMIQSVERAVAILKCFDGHDELGLTEISQMIGLHKSTTAGIVNTLKNEKLLEQNALNNKFKLGIELFRLSSNVKIDLKEICEPYLDELLAATKETVNLVVRSGDNVVYIEKKESPHSMRICTHIGQKVPLYCTATGKAILAFLTDVEIDAILSRTKFSEFTSNTLKSKEAVMEQLAQIRKNGYGCDMEELEYGLVCVGVPILNNKKRPIGGISVSGPSMRMTKEFRTTIKDMLVKKAEQICKEINI